MERITDIKLILGLMLLQLAVCLPFIASFPIALDEPFTIFWSQQEMGDLSEMFKNENNPPLHFILMNVWIKMFGTSAVAVRSLSLIFSVLTIPILFKLGKKLMNNWLGLFACTFFIFSTFNHYHAMEARVYSLMVFLAVFVMHDLYVFLFEKEKIFWRIGILNALLLYSHYLGAVVIGCELVILLFFIRQLKKPHFIYFFFSGLITIALYIPGLWLLLERLGHFSDNGTWVPYPSATELYGNILRFLNKTLSACIILGLTGVFGVIFRKDLGQRLKTLLKDEKALFLGACFLVPYFGMFLLSVLFQPVFLDRYLLFTTPFLYLGLGMLVFSILQHSGKKYLAFLLLVPMIISCYFIPRTNREPDKIAAYIYEVSTPNSAVLICPPFYNLTFMYHFNAPVFNDYKMFEEGEFASGVFPIYNVDDANLTDYDDVFYIDANAKFLYPDNKILADLDNRYVFLESKVFKGDFAVYHYKK